MALRDATEGKRNRMGTLLRRLRSVALSLFLIGLLYAYYWFARIPDNIKQDFTESFWGNPLNQILLLLPLITACFVDYLSLWKTRYLLSHITAFTRNITVMGVIFADLVGTIVLYISMFTVLAIGILAALTGAANGRILPVIPMAFKLVFEKFVLEGSSGLGLLPAATLLTSAWLWAYILAAYAMRLLSYIPPVLRFLSRFMDFTEHPVRSLGWVIAVLSSGAVAVGTAL